MSSNCPSNSASSCSCEISPLDTIRLRIRSLRCLCRLSLRRAPRASLLGAASDAPVFGCSAPVKMREPKLSMPQGFSSASKASAAHQTDVIPMSKPIAYWCICIPSRVFILISSYYSSTKFGFYLIEIMPRARRGIRALRFTTLS